MIDEQGLALFLLLGKSASTKLAARPDLVVRDSVLRLGPDYDLAELIPDAVRHASETSEAYRLFFVFERFLRDLAIGTLASANPDDWWDEFVPPDVKQEVTKLEETEDIKGWMALDARDKSALLTYPQILKIIDACWKSHFRDLLRDKALVMQARTISHLRNTICHMSIVSDEEMERIRQTMRDWFRRVSL